MIAILYPLKMDKNLSEAYSSIYKEGTKYGLTKGTGKPGGAMKDYLDKKAKQLEDEKKKQKPEYRNNPAFGDPSHHSNAKSKNEEFVAERRGSSPEKLKQNRDKAFTPKKALKDTGNPIQNAWNKFVPPPESSNNPNVRSGKLKPGKLEGGLLKKMNTTASNINKPIKTTSKVVKKGKKVISSAIQKVDKLNKMADKLPGQVKTGAKIALGAGAAVLGAKALMDRRKKKKEDQMRQKNEGTFRAEWEAFKLIEREDYIERFENWKNGLVEEGYDVSRWTMEDLVETFITENDLFSSQESIIDALFEADKKGKGSGTKDACYHKVKSRYSVWPSAYASGALVKCRKKGAKNWGNSSKKEDFSDWRSDLQLNEIIEKGTKGKVDFRTGKQTTDTGKKTKEGYPISQEKQVMKTKRVTVNNPKGRKRNESPMGKTIGKLNQVKSKQWKAEDEGDTKTANKMYDRRKKLSGVLYDKTGNFHERADND